MRSFSAQLRLHQRVLMDNGSLWGPLLFWLIMLAVNFVAYPQDFIGSLAVLLLGLFVLMTWLTYSYINQLPIGLEKVISLKLRKRRRFYQSLLCYLALIGVFFVILGIGASALGLWLHGARYFSRTLNWWDWFGGFLMLLSVVPVAITTGLIWQRRVLSNRRLAGVLTVLMVVLGTCGEAIVTYWHPYLYMLGLLPPISTIAQLFNTSVHIGILDLCLAWLMSLGYSIFLLMIHQVVLSHRQFLF